MKDGCMDIAILKMSFTKPYFWSIHSIKKRNCRAADLRAIADKIDELDESFKKYGEY